MSKSKIFYQDYYIKWYMIQGCFEPDSNATSRYVEENKICFEVFLR